MTEQFCPTVRMKTPTCPLRPKLTRSNSSRGETKQVDRRLPCTSWPTAWHSPWCWTCPAAVSEYSRYRLLIPKGSRKLVFLATATFHIFSHITYSHPRIKRIENWWWAGNSPCSLVALSDSIDLQSVSIGRVLTCAQRIYWMKMNKVSICPIPSSWSRDEMQQRIDYCNEAPKIATADKWDRCLCREFSLKIFWADPFPGPLGIAFCERSQHPNDVNRPQLLASTTNATTRNRLQGCHAARDTRLTVHTPTSTILSLGAVASSVRVSTTLWWWQLWRKDHSLCLLDFNSAGRNLLELFASQLPMAPICHQQNFRWSICSRRREKTQAAVPGVLRPGGQERGRRIEEVSVHLIMPTYYGSVSLCLLDLAYSNCTCYCHDIQYCQRYAIEDLYDRTQKCHPMQKLSCNILHVSSETN